MRILFGEVGQVVKGIRQSITKRGLSGPKRKTLNAVANYLYRNRSRMRYDEYLANGWPIASGPVEGACKNLINPFSANRCSSSTILGSPTLQPLQLDSRNRKKRV